MEMLRIPLNIDALGSSSISIIFLDWLNSTEERCHAQLVTGSQIKNFTRSFFQEFRMEQAVSKERRDIVPLISVYGIAAMWVLMFHLVN